MYTAEIIAADFKTTPYPHQLKELEEHGLDVSRALLWQMRAGKSKLVINTACMLYRKNEIDAVVILRPNGVHENWVRRELPKHHWDTVKHEALVWNTAVSGEMGKKRVPAAERDA